MDISVETADIELVPASLYGGDGLRLKVGGYIPLVVYVATSATLLLLVCVIWPQKRATRNENGELDQYGKSLASWRNSHNFFMFAYSGVCCLTAFVWMLLTGQLTSWQKMACQPVEGTYMRVLSTSFTLSKIYEWLDTMFLIKLGRRPFNPFSAKGFLHLYHHATTFCVFCFVMNFPGPEKMGMLLNGFVHTLMYNHYWKAWKTVSPALITVAQMIQLAFVMYVWLDIPRACQDKYGAASGSIWFYVPVYGMVGVYLVFFIVFFAQRFVFPLFTTKKDKKK